MASTNKTTNYDLSQYIGTDKPTYLTDYNQDMSKIDAGIHAAKSEADNNATSIGTLSNLTTTAKTDLVSAVNEIDGEVTTNTNNIATNTSNIATNTTHIGTLTNLTTTSKTDLVVAANEINAKVGNLTNLDTVTKTDLVSAVNEIVNKFNFSYKQDLNITTSSANVVVNNSKVSSAYNSDGSVGKIYGWFDLNNTNGSGYETVTVTIADTGLRPSSAITINGVLFEAYERNSTSGVNAYSHVKSFTLNTDGTVTFDTPVWYDEESAWSFVACLIFATDFGDTPIPPTP